jgi:F-type H+-transporting ATPase subunit delta
VRNTIVAKRYAKALFAVGKEEEALDAYSETLGGLAELLAKQPDIADALSNPQYPLEVREKVVGHLVKALDASQVMGNFLRLLVQKRRAEVLPEIAEVFQTMVDAERNISRGTVITAIQLDAGLKEKVQSTLEKITGKQVIFSTQVDPSIIGGIVAKVGDLVLDGSIRSQVAGLKESIKGSE